MRVEQRLKELSDHRVSRTSPIGGADVRARSATKRRPRLALVWASGAAILLMVAAAAAVVASSTLGGSDSSTSVQVGAPDSTAADDSSINQDEESTNDHEVPTGEAKAPTNDLAGGPVSVDVSPEVVSVGEPLTTRLIAESDSHRYANFGLYVRLDRWSGSEWVTHRNLVLCMEEGCIAEPVRLDEELLSANIGLLPSEETPYQFATDGLSPGWYRVVQEGAAHVFTDDVESLLPLVASDSFQVVD